MSLFHYVTYKYVVIKDKRLGIAYYLLAALILIYTSVQIVLNKAYLKYDNTPSGNLRIITNSPPLKEHEGHLKVNEDYCCEQKVLKKVGCQECRSFDGLALNWPVESKAITIATYIKERWEETGHDKNDPEEYIVLREDSFFTRNPEHALLKIEHSISALSSSDDPFAASHRMMNGWIVSANGSKIKQLNSDGTKKPDKIRLKELLQAAGISSLDNHSDALNARARSYRENGVLLRVTIEYTNSEKTLFGTSVPEYKYMVRRIPYSDYKVKQEIPVIDSYKFDNVHNASSLHRRIVRKRFATKVEFTQSGKIGRFSLSNLIIQLISGMGLLTITATIIDLLALYILPAKTIYSQYIYENSPELNVKLENPVEKIKND